MLFAGAPRDFRLAPNCRHLAASHRGAP